LDTALDIVTLLRGSLLTATAGSSEAEATSLTWHQSGGRNV